RDALRPHLHRQLLPDRGLHEAPQRPREPAGRRDRRPGPPRHGGRLHAAAGPVGDRWPQPGPDPDGGPHRDDVPDAGGGGAHGRRHAEWARPRGAHAGELDHGLGDLDPGRSLGSLPAHGLAMKRIRTPRLASNLYRDLRDRRMLIPAIALVVALVAVPVLLKKSASSSPPPPAPVADAGAPSAAEPAVVTREVGVTDYRRRLDQLHSKDPFRRHFMGLPKSSKLSTTTPSTSSSTSSTSTADTTAGGTTSLGASATPSPSAATGATSVPGTGSAGSPTGKSTQPSGQEPRLFAFRVSIAIGRPGHLTHRSNVKRLTLLPSPDKPMVAFLGVTSDGERALFSVSEDVSAVRGDGRCFP